MRFSAFQTIKNYNDTVSVPEASTIKDSNQATPDVNEPAPTTEEAISEPSEYEVMRTNAIAKRNRVIQTKLEKVISYTKQTMAAYMSEEDLTRLCEYITEYSAGGDPKVNKDRTGYPFSLSFGIFIRQKN